MELSGRQQKQLHTALISAFPTKADLKQLVSFVFNENLEAIADDGNLKEVVFDLIQWMEAHNRTEQFVLEAHRTNPDNLRLKAFAIHLKLLAPDKWGQSQQFHESERTTNPALDEFVAILRKHARSVLDDLERKRWEDINSIINGSATVDAETFVSTLEDAKKQFIQLHEEHVEAIKNGQWILAHELVRQIHMLLRDSNRKRSMPAQYDPFTAYSPSLGYDSEDFVRQYPGRLPTLIQAFMLKLRL